MHLSIRNTFRLFSRRTNKWKKNQREKKEKQIDGAKKECYRRLLSMMTL